MMSTIGKIVTITFLVVATGSAKNTYQVKVEKGDFADVSHKPLVYVNVKSRSDREKIYSEIRTDERGQLAPVTEAKDADMIIAFLPKGPNDQDYASLDASAVSADATGHMIAYSQIYKDRMRIVWKDALPNRPAEGMREFIKALTEYHSAHPFRWDSFPVADLRTLPKEDRPTISHKETAQYDPEAVQKGITGVVALNMIFTSSGQIADVRVIRGLPYGLTGKALEAVAKIRFKPATRNGVPIDVRGLMEFTFDLKKPIR